MRAHVERGRLLAALGRCSYANDVGHHVCIGKTLLAASAGSGGPDVLGLYTNDLSLAIDLAIPAVVEIPGSVGVATKHLAAVVQALPTGGATLSAEGNKLTVSGTGRRKSHLPTLEAENFPEMREPSESAGSSISLSLRSATLAKLIGTVRHAMAPKSPDRVQLQAIRLESRDGELTAVALDSYRLAKATAPAEGAAAFECTIPRALVASIEEMCMDTETVELTSAGGLLYADSDDCLVSAAMPQGEFPNWREIVAATVGESACTVRRDALIEAIKGVMAARSAEGVLAVKLDAPFEALSLALARDTAEAEDMVPVANAASRRIDVEYNAGYLLEALRHAGEEIRVLVVPMGLAEALMFESEGYLSWVCALVAQPKGGNDGRR